jgi:DNA-binding GntR family transcriptional regulator
MLPNRRIRVPVVTKARFRELLRIRVAVEGLAVEEAARRIRMDDVDRMEALNREFAAEMQRRQADGVKLFRINKDIHFLLYEAAGMPMLLPVIEGLWLQIGPVLHLSLRMRANANARGKNPAPNWHKRMILGLRKRDAAAARRGLVGDMTSAADQILAEGHLPD